MMRLALSIQNRKKFKYWMLELENGKIDILINFWQSAILYMRVKEVSSDRLIGVPLMISDIHTHYNMFLTPKGACGERYSIL